MTYKLLPGFPMPDGSILAPECILRVEDNTFIRIDEENFAYQEYLDWLKKGNTPIPCDTPSNEEESN